MRRNIFGAIVVAGGLVLLTSATSFAQSSLHRAANPAHVIAPAATPKASAQPEAEKPEVEQPEAKTPAAKPEVETPEVDKPEVETPDVNKPEVEKPEAAQKETGTTNHQSATEQGDHED